MLNISSDVIRGYNDTIILYLLLDKPSYGYEISKQIKLISEEKYVIKETTLYSAFTRLEKNGYITSFSSSDNASGKRRTYYQITNSGREYYRMKCEEWKLTLDVSKQIYTILKETFYGNYKELSGKNGFAPPEYARGAKSQI